MMGRLTRDPEVRYTTGSEPKAIASYSIAVDRRFKRDGQPEADFFNCTSFGKQAEFVEKYLHKGTKIVIQGEMQNNNWTGNDGVKHYSDRILVNSVEFAESKAAAARNGSEESQNRDSYSRNRDQQPDENGFMKIDDSISEELPFA